MAKQRIRVNAKLYKGQDLKKQRQYHADIKAANMLESF